MFLVADVALSWPGLWGSPSSSSLERRAAGITVLGVSISAASVIAVLAAESLLLINGSLPVETLLRPVPDILIYVWMFKEFEMLKCWSLWS